MSKRLSKYVADFDYIDKALIVSSATSGWISIISFASIIGVLVGIVSGSFSCRNNKETVRNNKK